MLPLTVIMLKNKHMILKLLNCTAIYFSPNLVICFNMWSASMFAFFFSLHEKVVVSEEWSIFNYDWNITESGSNSKESKVYGGSDLNDKSNDVSDGGVPGRLWCKTNIKTQNSALYFSANVYMFYNIFFCLKLITWFIKKLYVFFNFCNIINR